MITLIQPRLVYVYENLTLVQKLKHLERPLLPENQIPNRIQVHWTHLDLFEAHVKSVPHHLQHGGLLQFQIRVIIDVLGHHVAGVDEPSLRKHREHMLLDDGVLVRLLHVFLSHLGEDRAVFGD